MNDRSDGSSADPPNHAHAHLSVFPGGPRATAWVLDDSPQQARAIKVALEPTLDVRLFHDSPQLLETLANEQPEVLILDVEVPEISGLEVLRIVRAAHDELTLPVLMLTAERGGTTALEAIRAGANDYVIKPFVAAELHGRVITMVRVRTLHARAQRAERELSDALAREARARADAVTGQAQLRLVTDTIPFLISFVTPEETYGLVNKAYEDWFGIPAAQLVGRTVRELIGEAAYEVLGPYVKRGLAGERFSFEQHDVPYRFGGTRDVRVTFVPLILTEGAKNGYVALLEDITIQRAAEAERERLSRIRSEEIERRAQFEKQLIGIVSHDLRTPLNVISLSSGRLARDEDLSVGAHKHVVRMQNATDRAVRMVCDLLDFTQARLGGGLPIERQSTDIHVLLDKLLTELEAAFPERQIEYRHEGAAHGEWDPERISQLAQNLITNALKYSPDDSVVAVSTCIGEGRLTMAVHNRGDAIPEDKLPVLFEPLQRGVHRIDRGTRSVGLGLYIVKKIVEAHGGSVDVASSEEHGTTFTVVLPLAPPAAS